MFEINIENILINLIAKRNSGKSYLLKYLVKIQKHEFEKNLYNMSYRYNKSVL